MSCISIQHVFLALCCYNLPFSVNTEKGRFLVFIFFKLILNTAVTENRRKVSSKLLQEVKVLKPLGHQDFLYTLILVPWYRVYTFDSGCY